MDAETLKEIERLTLQANDRIRIGGSEQEFAHMAPAVIVGTEVKSLSSFLPGKDRMTGVFTTSLIPDFCAYIATHTGKEKAARAFISPEQPSATVFFDIHQRDDQYWGRGEHSAMLTLKPTAAWTALEKLSNAKYDQQDLVSLIEDWAPNFTGGGNAETELSQKQSIAGIRKITITKLSQETNVERDLGARRSALEDIQAQSDKETPIPTYLNFRCVPFVGLGDRTVRLRVAILTGGEKPILVLRPVGMEGVKEEVQNEFKSLLQTKLGKSVSEIVIGDFDPHGRARR